MHRRSATIPLVLAALVLPGCQTSPSKEAWTFSLTRQCLDAYAGTDLQPVLQSSHSTHGGADELWLFALATFPLSLALVVDAVALPVTVPRDLVAWVR